MRAAGVGIGILAGILTAGAGRPRECVEFHGTIDGTICCPPTTILYPGPGWYAAPLWPFTLCMRGPGLSIKAPRHRDEWRMYDRLDYSCMLFDADGDGDVDLRDWAILNGRT